MNVHQLVPAEVEEEDFFLMSNLRPKHTGLPMVVWVSHKGHARHDARVKVCRTHGDQIDVNDMAVVSVCPTPELIEGPLRPSDLKLVQAWIALNAEALIAHWEGSLDSIELGLALRKL